MASDKAYDVERRFNAIVPSLAARVTALESSDTWHSLGGLSGFSVTRGRYRLKDANHVEVDVDVNGNASHANSVDFANTMNSASRPGNDYRVPLAKTGNLGTNLTDQSPRLFIGASGTVTVLVAGNDTSEFSTVAIIPLD